MHSSLQSSRQRGILVSFAWPLSNRLWGRVFWRSCYSSLPLALRFFWALHVGEPLQLTHIHPPISNPQTEKSRITLTATLGPSSCKRVLLFACLLLLILICFGFFALRQNMQEVECDRFAPSKEEGNPCIELINTSKFYLLQILGITVTYFSFIMHTEIYANKLGSKVVQSFCLFRFQFGWKASSKFGWNAEIRKKWMNKKSMWFASHLTFFLQSPKEVGLPWTPFLLAAFRCSTRYSYDQKNGSYTRAEAKRRALLIVLSLYLYFPCLLQVAFADQSPAPCK